MKGLKFAISWGSLLLSGRLVPAEPFNFPLPNGFPFPDESALEQLFTTAGGNFTNMPLAPKFDDDSLTSWKLQAFNEFMEVAFFTQLISNITNRVPGYELDEENESHILDTLKTIQAQEEMHAYNANDAVRNFANGSHIFPCTYTFTDLYIGLLTDIQVRTARSLGADSYPIIYVLAQALGQEGQQSGWFRSLQGKHPSSQPFLTSSTRELVFSWLQRVIIPGSCPNLADIPLSIYPSLDVQDEVIGTGPITLLVPGPVDPTSQSVAFVNGALVPTVVPFNVTGISEYGMRVNGATDTRGCSKDVATRIVAEFPYAHNVMHGMTIATIVKKGLRYVTAEDVTNGTIYGPAIIEVQ
ncbi:hypothetical protein M426DRAFT_66336 [Hypoxylon sp. CI-4A]|nr:hypothetical protein M426DRAFT_66336 [Hypoxylon sp. CI-4A]